MSNWKDKLSDDFANMIFVEGNFSVNKFVNAVEERVGEAVDDILKWADKRQKDNTIYRISNDELQDDWIDKIKEVFEK